jgi:solute carrier family 25 (mitochondrial dicarboxylate transporter), member 10
MLLSIRRLGYRGLFDGISGTWLRQMSYSVCRFWAYDESKKLLGAGGPNAPAWKLAAAGSMGGYDGATSRICD